MFGFRKQKLPRFSEACLRLSKPEAMAKMAEHVLSEEGPLRERRIRALSFILMGTAGHFTKGFMAKLGGFWQESDKLIRETNPDIITLEAISWLTFVANNLWLQDKTRDPEGYKLVDPATVYIAGSSSIGMLERETGYVLKHRFHERQNYYHEAEHDKAGFFEPFVTVIFDSVGRTSFDDGSKLGDPMLSLEWTYISLYVGAFAVTMSAVPYYSFKEGLKSLAKTTKEDD